jgi:hypothetical protein
MLHEFLAWHPPVGVWIGILGLLGVIVPLIRDPKEISRGEKAAWTLILFMLLLLEVKSVYQDRNEHDEAEKESRQRSEQNFREIANGIQETVNELNTTIKEGREHFDRTMAGIAGTISTQTGGSSYAYLSFVPEQHFLFFAHAGKYPLYGVVARIVDLDQAKNNPFGITVTVGDMIKGHGNMLDVPKNMTSLADHFNANVFFTARNGGWTETLRVQKKQDGWARAIRVTGEFTTFGKSKVMCETIDPKFQLDPSGQVEKDWLPDSTLPRCQ